MPRLSLNERRRVIELFQSEFAVSDIEKRFNDEKIVVTKRSLYRLIKKFRETKQYTDLHCRKREKKITEDMATTS